MSSAVQRGGEGASLAIRVDNATLPLLLPLSPPPMPLQSYRCHPGRCRIRSQLPPAAIATAVVAAARFRSHPPLPPSMAQNNTSNDNQTVQRQQSACSEAAVSRVSNAGNPQTRTFVRCQRRLDKARNYPLGRGSCSNRNRDGRCRRRRSALSLCRSIGLRLVPCTIARVALVVCVTEQLCHT